MHFVVKSSIFSVVLLYVACLIFSPSLNLVGEWQDDRFEGWGKLRYADQSEYEGDLHQGLRHGQVDFTCVSCTCILSLCSCFLDSFTQGQLQHHMQFIPPPEEEDNMTDGSVTSTSTPPHPFLPGHQAAMQVFFTASFLV